MSPSCLHPFPRGPSRPTLGARTADTMETMRKPWVYKRKNIKGFWVGWYESGRRKAKAFPHKSLAERFRHIKYTQLNSDVFTSIVDFEWHQMPAAGIGMVMNAMWLQQGFEATCYGSDAALEYGGFSVSVHRRNGDMTVPANPGPLSNNRSLIMPAGRVCCSMGDWAKHVRGVPAATRSRAPWTGSAPQRSGSPGPRNDAGYEWTARSSWLSRPACSSKRTAAESSERQSDYGQATRRICGQMSRLRSGRQFLRNLHCT
jgi:hypothetical protein